MTEPGDSFESGRARRRALIELPAFAAQAQKPDSTFCCSRPAGAVMAAM